MTIVNDPITLDQLKTMSEHMFGNFVKAVVDIDRQMMAIDANLHSDLEAFLLQNGSKQVNLWGINLYPELTGSDFVEFDSMINLKPSQGNRSRGVDSLDIQLKIREVVSLKVAR